MFIQVIQGKVADAAGLEAAMDRWVAELQPGAQGWLGSTGGFTDDGMFGLFARSGGLRRVTGWGVSPR